MDNGEERDATKAAPSASATPRAPARPTAASGDRRPHVVVVGAGFGGLAAVKGLARAPVDVTVVDRRNHHLFQPLLYQVATAALSPADIAAPIRAVLRDLPRVRVVLGEVTDVDTGRRRVKTADGEWLDYDYLVLATGSTYAYFGHEEWAPHAPGLKTLEDAVVLRRKLLLAFEQAEVSRNPDRHRALLTFVLVGAGPTGVEMAGAVAELANATLARDFRRIDPRSARILLIEAGPRVLPDFAEELSRYAAGALERLGVDVLLNTPVEAVSADGVVAAGEFVAAGSVIWCAGVAAGPAGRWLDAPQSRDGAVRVAADLSMPSLPEVFVIGDTASLDGQDGRPLPNLAPVAQQQGEYVADLIHRKVTSRKAPAPFVYRDRGVMATIGRSAAVARIGRLRMKGFGAWLLWGLVHIYMLIGFRNRLVVFTSWVWQWLTHGRGARLITGVEFGTDAAEHGRGRDSDGSLPTRGTSSGGDAD